MRNLMLAFGWIILLATAAVLPTLSVIDVRADDPQELKIHNLDKINTPADEDDPFVSADGSTLFFTSNPSGQFHLMSATRRSKTQPYANAKPLDDLNSKANDVSPFLMPRETDGSEYIYFASQSTSDAGKTNFDILFSRRLKPSEPFQRIGVAPVQPVCTEEDELHPWVMADAREMYFSRKTKEGWRIGHATGSARRSFEKVELLDLPIGFYHPSVSRDNLTMYVQGPAEEGSDRSALFMCKRPAPKSKWGAPEPLRRINSSEGKRGDCSPCLSLDGTTLYFASDRPGGKGGLDIYYIVLKDLKGKP